VCNINEISDRCRSCSGCNHRLILQVLQKCHVSSLPGSIRATSKISRGKLPHGVKRRRRRLPIIRHLPPARAFACISAICPDSTPPELKMLTTLAYDVAHGRLQRVCCCCMSAPYPNASHHAGCRPASAQRPPDTPSCWHHCFGLMNCGAPRCEVQLLGICHVCSRIRSPS
jgi:hypothetical protein